ncbi:cytochrome P450 4g1-like [Haematobia irritans]|uniref:cytochrome P450 4g1-like n=1 Tax=Haematobia irritans TaxID=7368 RepID=UPI003F4FE7A8
MSEDIVTQKMTENVSATFSWSPLYTSLLGIAVIAILYEVMIRNTRKYKLLKNMPCPPKLPLIGNAHLLLNKTNHEMMSDALKYHEQYGRTICAWLGPVVIVFLTDPRDIELVLGGSVHLEKSEEYRYFQPWFGDGLLISKGHHWKHHRKMIAPTFHQSILKSFVPTFAQHSKAVVQRLSNKLGKEFDVHEYMSQTTVEILLATAMGVKEQMDGDKCLEYAQAVVDMCDIIHRRQTKFYYRLDSIFNMSNLSKANKDLLQTILTMTRKVVNDRRKNFDADARAIVDDENEMAKQKLKAKKEGLRDDLDDIDEQDVGVKKRLALLDAMMAMSKNPEIEWTDKDVYDEVNTIMFEGHDTTSAGSSFVLCMLGIHKDVQAKVMAEQEAIFGNDFLRDCTFNDTLEMKYLECVILETLRLYPPVPIIARKAAHDFKLASGPYTVPKDTTVVIAQYSVHRNPTDFPNPHEFNPEHFNAETMNKRHYYSFIPFSAGPRSCVGRKFAMLKLKVLLSTILRNYSVDCRLKPSEFKLQADIILKMTGGFNISLEKRTRVK